ncbi:uncharacterized protein [Atheta coriaria]|uniref:uncharacterized protein n=1 Tax=Dalotia coriaria TaxID=877792 RepID=UPI0031F47099
MARRRGRRQQAPSPITYPPVTTKKWIPPDQRQKQCRPKPSPYPPQLTQKLTISSLLKVWHDYKVINDCAVLLGDLSMYHPRFTYVTNGLQGHAICIVCALYSKLCPSFHWCSRTLDEIVIIGDRYFQRSLRFQKNPNMTICQLNKDIFIHSHKITICLRGERFQGLIFKDLDTNSKDYLANVIKEFFGCYDCGILCAESNPKRYFTIWKFRNGFFLFDPVDHDEMCWPLKKPFVGKGHTFTVRFPTTDRLVQVLQRQMIPANISFELIPVEIERIAYINTRYPACLEDTCEEDPNMKDKLQKEADERTCLQNTAKIVDKPPAEEKVVVDDDDDAEPDVDQGEGDDYQQGKSKVKKKAIVEKPRVESVTYFNYIIPERIGIMLAETHQDDPEFERCYSLKDFCMALGAIVHLRENKAKYWTTRIVTNCLRLGLRICIQSLILIKPDHILKVQNIIKKIELNEKNFTPEIQQYGAIGKLQSQDSAILDLLPAIREVLSEHDAIIIQGPLVVAIWKEEDLFYLFDAHERDPNGFAIVKEVQIGSVMEAVDYISGVACLTWFTDLRDLVDMYMANVDRDKRHDTFIISTVEVNDYIELPSDWCNFKAICPNRWILQGSFAQGDIKFSKDTRNTQCTANCAMALTYCHLVKIDDWTTETIDEVLDQGDIYYKKCIDHHEKKGTLISPMLLVSELLPEFVLKDMLVTFDVSECMVNGVITIPEEYRNTWNLQKGFKEFFKDNDYGILTCRGISVAVFKAHGQYFYFDSHDRNNFGFVVAHGKACVQKFLDSDTMAEVIMGNLGPDVTLAIYNISKLDVKIFNPIPPGEMPDEDDSSFASVEEEEEEDDDEENKLSHLVVERPLFNYTKITKKRAILRSSTHQKKIEMFDVYAGKQTMGNLMAAPGMARIFIPNEWTVDILDDVLKTGQSVYEKSIQNFYKNLGKDSAEEEEVDFKETDDITVDNVIKDFKIGVNKFIVEFEMIAEGVISANGTDLANALKSFFSEEVREEDDHKEIIVHTDYYDVVLWKSGTLYYLFDPNPRDEQGMIYGKEEWSDIPLDPTLTEMEYDDHDDNIFDLDEDIQEEEESKKLEIEMNSEKKIRQLLEKEWREYGFVEEEQSVSPVRHPLEYWEAHAKEKGRAYIMWATKPKFLIKHLIANNPPKYRDDSQFGLFRMVLRNIPDVKDVYDPVTGPKPDEIAGDWNEWREITYGQWILRGGMHEKNVIFPECNRGLQAHANCLIALSYGHIFAMSQFTKNTIDQILKYGDRLYTSTRRIRRRELESLTDLELTPEEIDEVLARETYTIENLVKTFCVGDESVAVKISETMIEGEINAEDVEDEFDVSRGLEQFFAAGGNRLGILQSKTHTVAVFRMGTFYYMFDPHECGPHGIKCQNGVACITRFQEVQPICDLFLENVPKCGKNFFTIQEISIGAADCTKVLKEELRATEDPLKLSGFEPVVPGKMIIRGTLSQEDPMFGRGANAQSSPIACVALAMTLIHSTEYWTKMIIDDVVCIGDDVYAKYIDRCDTLFNPWEEKLTLALCPKNFKIGKNKVNFELRQTDQSGVIDIKAPDTQNLRQGIENFFLENVYGVLETDLLTVAIWQECNGVIDYIYMFDPNPRGPSGMPETESGVACTMRFASPKLLSEHVISLVSEDAQGMFLITPIEIIIERDGKKVKKTPKYGLQKPEKQESPHNKKQGRLSYYTIPPGEMDILRGSKSQNHKCYSDNSRGNQDVPNCIVAYVMDKLIPINKWTYKNIDMILDMGDLLFKDSYMVYNPKEEKIGLETLIRDVVIKDIRVKISVGAPVLTAHFGARPLTEALVACFNLKNFCIILLDRWALALFKKCDTYYMFDPTDLNLYGNRIDRCGSAAVLRFESIDKLIEVLIRNLESQPIENEVFRIIIAAVKQIEKIPVGTEFKTLQDNKDLLDDIMPGPPLVSSEPDCDKILFGHTKPHKNRKKKYVQKC